MISCKKKQGLLSQCLRYCRTGMGGRGCVPAERYADGRIIALRYVGVFLLWVILPRVGVLHRTKKNGEFCVDRVFCIVALDYFLFFLVLMFLLERRSGTCC